MPPVDIVSIKGTPSTAIRGTDKKAIVPGTKYTLWDVTNPDVADGARGSKVPLAFELPDVLKASASKITVPLAVDGAVTFPPDWKGELVCSLVGLLKADGGSDAVPVLQSDDWKVSPKPENPAVEQFSFASMKLLSPSAIVSAVPFCCAGDFEWRIACTTKDPPLVGLIKTRLELYWFNSTAFTGRKLVPGSFQRTRLDLQGVYPVSLARLFVPTSQEVDKVPDLKTHQRAWWVQNSVSRIGQGAKYNTITGKSGYGVGCCGGSFDLDGWLAGSNPLLNSFDLTALLQIASALLTDKEGNELTVSTWVCMSPLGYISPGVPYGMVVQVDDRGVNSPYYSNLEPSQPLVKLADDVKYLWKTRAWLEGTIIGDAPTVVDTSYLMKDPSTQIYAPEVGLKDRDAFAKSRLEKATGTTGDFLDNGMDGGNNCFSNNDFGLSQSGEVVTASQRQIARVGVYNVFGVNEPREGPVPAPFYPTPPTLREQIKKIITGGRNKKSGVNPISIFNDASLKPKNVFPALLSRTSYVRGDFGLRVGLGVSVATYNVAGVRLSPSEADGRIVVKIHVYDNFHAACEAMAFELCKYECDLSAALVTPATTFCQYFVQTVQSILCVRSNLFIEVSAVGKTKAAADVLGQMSGMIDRLDLYLGQRGLARTQVRRPVMTVDAAAEQKVAPGTSFGVGLTHPETLASTLEARTSNGSLVFLVQADGAAKRLDFHTLDYARVVEENKVRVTLLAAHEDTFHPGSASLIVQVLK